MVTSNLIGAGVYIRCFSLARQLVLLGYSVTLMTSGNSGSRRETTATIDGVRVVSVGERGSRRVVNSGLNPAAAVRRMAFLDRDRFDLTHVFGHRPTAAWPALAWRKRHGAPLIADWADLWSRDGIAEQRGWGAKWALGALDERWDRQLRARADGITAICSYLRQRAISEGAAPDRVWLLPPGANTDIIWPLDRGEIRDQFGLPLAAPIVAHCGYAPYDAELLARSFLALSRRRSDAILLMTGARWRSFERLIAGARSAARIIHMGSVAYERLGEALACGDAMLLPYTRRPVNLGRYPNKLGDYLAAGRPTITNNTGDCGELVARTGAGVLVAEAPEAFAVAAQRLAEDGAWRDALGQRARQVAEEEFTWRQRAQELDRIYRQLMS
jgi:glycosyltransferase involved in cell wall biosynthesis